MNIANLTVSRFIEVEAILRNSLPAEREPAPPVPKSLSSAVLALTSQVETQSPQAGSKMEHGGGYYLVTQDDDGSYGFTTPIGVCVGFFTRSEAERAAKHEEIDHRERAENTGGPIAAILRGHFANES